MHMRCPAKASRRGDPKNPLPPLFSNLHRLILLPSQTLQKELTPHIAELFPIGAISFLCHLRLCHSASPHRPSPTPVPIHQKLVKTTVASVASAQPQHVTPVVHLSPKCRFAVADPSSTRRRTVRNPPTHFPPPAQ